MTLKQLHLTVNKQPHFDAMFFPKSLHISLLRWFGVMMTCLTWLTHLCTETGSIRKENLIIIFMSKCVHVSTITYPFI